MGHLDHFELKDGQLGLAGWVLHHQRLLSHVSIEINDNIWASNVALTDRPDVLAYHHDVPYSLRSGFAVLETLGMPPWRQERMDLRLHVWSDGHELGVLDYPYRDLDAERRRLPVPSTELQTRVGTINFLEAGWRIYSDLKRSLERYGGIDQFKSILDWGCGCSRVLRYLIQDTAAKGVHGCDIDRDAIAWDRQHIPGAVFTPIQAYPPTPYAENQFDLVYGISIFTHLDEPTQFQWLEELRRITRPGGLVAVSVLGETYAPPDLAPGVNARGFADVRSSQSDMFAQFSDQSYYRVTHHSLAYIEKNWSRYFELLEYDQRSINSHQDLVIMRKRG
jgi:SAM-dependent methyltransferase